jgi:hypothetical protein
VFLYHKAYLRPGAAPPPAEPLLMLEVTGEHKCTLQLLLSFRQHSHISCLQAAHAVVSASPAASPPSLTEPHLIAKSQSFCMNPLSITIINILYL